MNIIFNFSNLVQLKSKEMSEYLLWTWLNIITANSILTYIYSTCIQTFDHIYATDEILSISRPSEAIDLWYTT